MLKDVSKSSAKALEVQQALVGSLFLYQDAFCSKSFLFAFLFVFFFFSLGLGVGADIADISYVGPV